MKWITYNIMALAFLSAGMYLFHKGSHNWGWLVFLSVISAVTPSVKPDNKSEVTKSEEPKKDLHQELQERANENNN